MTKLLPEKWHTLFRWLFIPVAFYAFVVLGTIGVGFYYSFFNWKGGARISFNGLDNYIRLFFDESFWMSFKNNLKLIAVCLVGQVGLGFLLSVLLASKFLRLRKVYKFIIFLPVVLSGVVVGFLWSMMYNSSFGLLNQFLSMVGLESFVRNWLGDPSIVMMSISVTLVWQYIGLNVVIFLSSIQNIPQDIIEASEVDGADAFQRLRFIITPLMYNTIKVAVVLCVSGNLKTFEHVNIMTRGGPGTASSVVAMYAYKQSFENMYFGYGSSIAFGIVLISICMVSLTNLIMRAGKKYDV